MSTINATTARRYATYGRAAGIVILVCAGGLWALPLPGVQQLPAKPVPVAPPPAPDAGQAKADAFKVDADIVDATATRLDIAVVHADKPKEPEKPIAENAEPPASGPEWTYLGPIHEADRNLAIISVGGHQKILAEGRTFGDTKLVSVDGDGISVEVNGAPKQIKRGDRSGSTVAWVRNLQTNTPAPRTPTAVPGQPGGNLPPEVRQRLLDRGVTPDQMQNWRGNRNGGGPGGGGGGGGGGPGGDRRNRATPGGGGGGGPNRGEVIQPNVPLNTKPSVDKAVPIDDPRRSIN